MSRTTKKILPWVLVSGLCCTTGVWAAQLGKLEVLSGGGEPFVAQVQVEAIQPEARPTLKARLAAPEAFRAARLELNPSLSALKFEVRDGSKPGTAVVRITADKPVPAGFMDALIELTWSGGRVAREYTFNVPKAPEVTKPANLPELAPNKVDAAKAQTPKTEAAAVTKPTGKPDAAPPERTHQVLKGETLSEIALQSMGQGVGLNQAMAAIFEANKNQFIEGSVHLLREGAVLQIPSRTSIRQRSKNEALLILARQDDRNVYSLQARQLGLLEASAAVPDQAALKGKDKPQDAGRIATGSIEKNSKPAASATGDRLKIAPGNTPNGGEAKADAAAEELLAKNKALKEANERISLLEKNVNDLQRLLEMQKDLAAKPDAATPAPSASETKSAVANPSAEQGIEPSPLGFEVSTDAVPQGQQAEPDLGTIDPAAAGLQTNEAALPNPATAGIPKMWLLGGGAGLALGLGALAVWFGFSKRRKKDLVLTAGTQDLGQEPAPMVFSEADQVQVSAPEPVHSEIISPLAQALDDDVLNARPAPVQVADPLVSEPSFKAALDEQQAFEAMVVDHAVSLSKQEMEEAASSAAPSPQDPVEAIAPDIEAEFDEPVQDDKAAAPDEAQAIPDLQGESEYAASQVDSLASQVDLNFPEDSIETPGASGERSILDDLGDLERSAAAAQAELDALRKAAMPVASMATAAEPASRGAAAVTANTNTNANALDQPSDEALEQAMADLNLDIPAEPLDEASWQEVATKLDLAGAYVEIGDNDGARELLDEIVKKGDADQVRKAKALLGALV